MQLAVAHLLFNLSLGREVPSAGGPVNLMSVFCQYSAVFLQFLQGTCVSSCPNYMRALTLPVKTSSRFIIVYFSGLTKSFICPSDDILPLPSPEDSRPSLQPCSSLQQGPVQQSVQDLCTSRPKANTSKEFNGAECPGQVRAQHDFE